MAENEHLAVSANVAAEMLGVSKPMIYRYMHMDGFPSFKLGNRTLISVDGLRNWVAAQVEKGAVVHEQSF